MKVGIIGCGGIAPTHIKVYQGLQDVELVGLCDLNVERAKNLASKFNVKNVYTNYWDMFEKEDLDLVDISTPTSTHCKIVCDASTAVPAILVEKPMGRSVAECDEMIKAVEKNKSKLCLGHCQIFSPHIQKAKSMVDSSFDLHSFRTTLKASFEKLRGFNLVPEWNVFPEQKGIIWEVCAHHSYLQLHFLPDIEEVYAVGRKVKHPVYDDFAVFLRTKNDRFGIIELSWIQKEIEVLYELRDTDGNRIKIDWEYDFMYENSEDHPYTVANVAKNVITDKKRFLKKWYRFGTCYLNKRKVLPTFNLITRYVDAIKNDLPSPVTPEDGRKTVKLLECIEKSLDERKPVKF